MGEIKETSEKVENESIESVDQDYEDIDCDGLDDEVDVEKKSITEDDISDEQMEAYEKEFEDFEKDEQVKEIKYVPVNDGIWEGDKGDSKWIPDDEKVPGKMNPDNESWKEIKEKYGIDGIEYKDGEPDFTPISKAEVKIDDFSESRDKNFASADIKEAERRGCEPDDVAEWRQQNKYTWHEKSDCETMQKVPSQVHNNMYHRGGISEKKREINEEEFEI